MDSYFIILFFLLVISLAVYLTYTRFTSGKYPIASLLLISIISVNKLPIATCLTELNMVCLLFPVLGLTTAISVAIITHLKTDKFPPFLGVLQAFCLGAIMSCALYVAKVCGFIPPHIVKDLMDFLCLMSILPLETFFVEAGILLSASGSGTNPGTGSGSNPGVGSSSTAPAPVIAPTGGNVILTPQEVTELRKERRSCLRLIHSKLTSLELLFTRWDSTSVKDRNLSALIIDKYDAMLASEERGLQIVEQLKAGGVRAHIAREVGLLDFGRGRAAVLKCEAIKQEHNTPAAPHRVEIQIRDLLND